MEDTILTDGEGEEHLSDGRRGYALLPSILGTLGDDPVFGGAADDIIDAMAGNDYVFAGNGNDIVYGDDGNDVLYGQSGQDTLDGEAGDDSLVGGEGNDVLFGGAGSDHLYGDEGDDRLHGDDGPDFLTGGAGRDSLHGGVGDDLLLGGIDDDVLWGDAGDDALYGEQGSDTLYGGDGNDSVDGGDGDDLIHGGDGDDLLVGGGGRDRIFGGNGADVIFGGGADDELDGGSGDDALFGADGADYLSGGDGNDTLYGESGDDRLFSGTGDDVLSGGDGDDYLSGGDGDDQLYGDAGQDTLDGGGGSDLLFGGAGNDVIHGAEGSDMLFGEAGDDFLDGGAGIDSIFGGDGNDTVLGGPGDDLIVGDNGADLLDGGEGADQVYGGADDDVLMHEIAIGQIERDFLDGGTGHDILRLHLTPTQMTDPELQKEISALATLISRTADPASETGAVFSAALLGVDVRNIEAIEINGVAATPGRPTIYVDPDAPDGGNGSQAMPFNSWYDVTWCAGTTYLQKAGSVSRDSLTITVSASADAPVVIGSYGEPGAEQGAYTTLIGSILFDGAAFVTLEGFRVTGADHAAIGVIGGSHHITIKDNEISDSDIGVWIAEGAGLANRVESNLIQGNRSHGVAVTLAGGGPGAETTISGNSILRNGDHGIEIQANYVIVEANEIGDNGAGNIGTSGIHVFASSPDEDSGRANIIRDNVVYHTREDGGPDGNGIQLDHWTRDNAVYGNVIFGNDGAGFSAFRSADFTFRDNHVFANMRSSTHQNVAYPAEVFIAAISSAPEDGVHGYVIEGNVIAAQGNTNTPIPLVVDAHAAADALSVGGNRYYKADGGDFYRWGADLNAYGITGTIGGTIEAWNASKPDGLPDHLGGVALRSGALVDGDEGIDLIRGTDGDDFISGRSGNDVLVGGSGNDRLDGGTGADTMFGGAGDDLYVVDSTADRIMEFRGGGTDLVLAYVDFALPGFVENATLAPGLALSLTGNSLANDLRGNDSDNRLDGGANADTLFGYDGNDVLIGGEGDDYLVGGRGNDLLDGGPGYDLLWGGEGRDVFVLRRGEEHGTISDFERGVDRLRLEGYSRDTQITYSGSHGLWYVEYSDGGVPVAEPIEIVGVSALGSLDFMFV